MVNATLYAPGWRPEPLLHITDTVGQTSVVPDGISAKNRDFLLQLGNLSAASLVAHAYELQYILHPRSRQHGRRRAIALGFNQQHRPRARMLPRPPPSCPSPRPSRFRRPPWRQRPEAKATLAAAAPASSVSASRSLAAPGRLGKLLGAEHNAVHWRRMAEWARRSVALWTWCRHGDARWGAPNPPAAWVKLARQELAHAPC